MDLSYHAMLATRIATIALVFTVSSCVLSKTTAEEENLGGKTETKAVTAEEKQLNGPQKPVAGDKSNQANKAGTKATVTAKPTQPTKQNQVVQETPAKPGSIRATNQKVSKLAVEGKLDKQRQVKKEVSKPIASDKKVIRYVNVETLNVRMDSTEDAPVVGKLTKGTMYHVSIEGDWAKIGDSQFVMTKFLSNQPPKKTGTTWTYRK
jgi:hypothetical protein